MSQSFNLTAQLNLRGPSNVRNIVSDIRRQLGSISADVNLRLDQNASRNVTQLNAALRNLNNTFGTTQTAARNAANAIRDFSQAVGNAGVANLPRQLNNVVTATQRVGATSTTAARQLNVARTEMEEFGRQSALAIRRFAAFSLATGAVFSFTGAINKGIAAFIEFDKEFVKLQQVTGESADGLKRLSNTITSLSVDFGVASGDLIKVSSTLAQAGLSAKDTERALKALALSALAPSFDDMNKTVEGSIALMRQFGIGASDLEKALGSVNSVAARFAVEASDIIAAIQRTGGVFASASNGVSQGTDALNEFIAVFTSIRATTRESAETIATGLRTIFTRVQRGGTIEALKEFGVNLTDAEGKFVGAYKAVELLSRGLNQIDPRDLKFSQIVEELGGFRQIGKVIPLIQQFGTAQEALKVAQTGQGSLAADAATAQLSLANQIAKVREEFTALVRDIGGSDTFQTLAKGALQLASGLIQVADSVKGVLPILGLMMAVRGASVATQYGSGFIGGLRRGNAGGAAAPRRNAYGGYISRYKKGGPVDVPVALMPGEAVVYPEAVKEVGVSKLRKMNYADRKPMAKGGKVGLVPGSGNTDSFYTTLPEGSFVIRKKATEALGGPEGILGSSGYQYGGSVQRFRGGSSSGLKETQRTHIGPKVPLSYREAMAAKKRGTGSLKVVSGKTERQINFEPNISTLINQRLRRKTGKTGVTKKELVEDISKRSPEQLFGDGGVPSVIFKELLASKKLEGLKTALLRGVKSRSVPQTLRSDSELDFILEKNIKPYLSKINTQVGSLWDELMQYQALTNPREVGGRTTLPAVKKVLGKSFGSTFASGGLIQKFARGTSKPLEAMGKADLLKEAERLGVNIPIELRRFLDPRAKGSEQTRAKIIKDLQEKRTITKTSEENIANRAKNRKLAVVGLRGDTSSSAVTTPGLKDKTGRQRLRGVPATLQTGSLPNDLATQVEDIIRSQSESIVAQIGQAIAKAAGTTPITDQKRISEILTKQLPNLSGLMFESGLAVAGAPYDPKSKAIDFNMGLGKKLANLFGVDPKALTDATNDATKEQAKRKLTKGQFDRGRRDKLRTKRLSRALGGFIAMAKGGMPLVDDLPNAPGSMLPMPGMKPGSPLYEIIRNGGGAIDYDRTLQRTTGDAAYASAKTPEQKEAVLTKYFRDPQARIKDAQSARLTQFGKQLQELVKKGVIQPKNLSIISKSSRTPGLAEHINQLFGIPVQNMVFTRGGSKLPALEALRTKGPRINRVARASGGEVPIMAQEGEYVINRKSAKAIGYGNLHTLNKYHSGGIVQRFARGSDSPLKMAMSGQGRVQIAKQLMDQGMSAAKALAEATKAIESMSQAAQQTAASLKKQSQSVGYRGMNVLAGRGVDITTGGVLDQAKEKEYRDNQRANRVVRRASRTRLAVASDGSVTRTPSAIDNARNEAAQSVLGRERAGGAGSVKQMMRTQLSNDRSSLRDRVAARFKDRYDAASDPAEKQKVQDRANKVFARANQSLTANAQQNYVQQINAKMQIAQQAAADDAAARIRIANFAKQSATAAQQQPTLFQKITQGISKMATAAQKSLGFGGGSGGGLIPSGSKGANMMAQARDARAQGLRGQAFRDSMAGSAGGGMSGKIGNTAMGLSFAIPMIADQFTTADPKTAEQAKNNAMISGSSTAIGSAAMLASMGPVGIAAGIVAGAGGLAKAFADAENAANDFNRGLKVDKLEQTLEAAAKSLDKFSKDIKNNALATEAKQNVLRATQQAQSISDSDSGNVRRGVLNLKDDGAGAAERSQILNNQGILAYLQSTELFTGSAETAKRNQSGYFSQNIPELSKERAKNFAGASDASRRLVESKVRSGSSVDGMLEQNSDEFRTLTKSLALADSAIQSQIMTIQNNVDLDKGQKDALIQSTIAIASERKAREIQSQTLKEMNVEALSKSTTILQNSLERMFQNMEQSIKANAFSLDKLTASAELTAAALSGSAKVGSVKLDSINVLQNRRGYGANANAGAIDQAASMFGSESQSMKGILQVAGKLEDTLLSTINSTLKNNPSASNEAVGIKLDQAIFKALGDLQLPPDLSTKLSSEVKNAVQDMRKSGDDKIDFSQLVEKIPQLGNVIDSAKRAQETAIQALEHWQNALNDYANSTNQLIDLQIDSNQKLRRATDILVSGQNELNRVLGKTVSLQSVVADTRAATASQTGGATSATDIRRQIQDLELTRQSQQSRSDSASQKGFAGKDEFMMMQGRLRETSVALRESYDALKGLSENTTVASAALNKMSEIQQKQQAGVSIIEKLVTSTPAEINKFNQALARLDNNMKGRANFGTNADQRRDSLEAFNMIMPFLGDKQSGMKANVLESMLKESGINSSPIMQQVIDSLRNPEADPQMAEAIGIYRESLAEQASANEQLAVLNQLIAANNADTAAVKLATAIGGVSLKFESRQLQDINDGIRNLIKVVQNNRDNNRPREEGAEMLARGGMVYASTGQLIDFAPKGTDTVPAMLTPGEFVVNRSATQKHLPLLKSINNGYSNGGRVGYYNKGGLVFGEPWALSSKEDALENSERTVNVSSQEYPRVTTDANLLSNLGTYFQKIFSIPGMFYATSRNAGAVSGWFKDDFTGFTGLDVVPALGSAFDSLKVKAGGESEGKITTTRSNGSSKEQPVGFAPTDQFFSTIVPYNGDSYQKIKLKEGQQNTYNEAIEAILKYIPSVAKSDTSITINGKKIITSADVASRPKPVPQVFTNPSSNGQKDIELRGLSISDNNMYGMMTEHTVKKAKTGQGQDQFIGNILGIQQGMTSLRLGGFDTNDRYSRIVAGLHHMQNDAGGHNYGAALRPLITNFDRPDLNIDSEALIANFNRLASLKETLQTAKQSLSSIAFEESSGSKENKEYVNKLNQLISGAVFKAHFAENEIEGNGSASPPLTLYNIPGDQWDKQVAMFDAQADIPRGSYAGKKGSTWIPVGTRKYAGTQVDAFETKKWFPWTSAGFNRADVLENLKAEYQKNNAANVKVQQGTVEEPFMKFNYRSITGGFDANKKLDLANSNKGFVAVDIDKDTINQYLNPFKDLDPVNIIGRSIYANNINEIKAPFQAIIDQIKNKTNRFNPISYKTIQKINSGDLASLDYSQETKDNAYMLPMIGQGTPFEASKYIEDVKQKLVNQNNQEAGKRAEEKNKRKTTVRGGNDLGAAREIIHKNLAPIAGILSAFNMKLMPLRSAQDMTPYGNLLLQGQKIFGEAVMTRMKGQKPAQSLYDVWGALGAVGQTFVKLGSGDVKGLSSLLGVAAGAYELDDNAKLADKVKAYGMFLSRQGSLSQGVGQQTLEKELGQDTQEQIKGIFGKQDIRDAGAGAENKWVKESDRTAPKTILDLGKKILNPYSFYPTKTRTQLFDVLINGLQEAKVNKQLTEGIGILKSFYGTYLDPIINADAGDQTVMPRGFDEQYPLANRVLQLFTNGAYGAIPDAKLISDLAKTRAMQKEEGKKGQQKPQQPVGLATGGVVYASNGQLVNYQPRGTDTVPAMLTPGEFVVNRAATQKHLPVLKAINSGQYSTGGMVNYLNQGGIIIPQYHSNIPNVSSTNKTVGVSNLQLGLAPSAVSALENFNRAFAQNAALLNINLDDKSQKAIDNFTIRLQNVANTISGLAIPENIQITAQHKVEVIINGGEALKGMSEGMKEYVVSSINTAVSRLNVTTENALGEQSNQILKGSSSV